VRPGKAQRGLSVHLSPPTVGSSVEEKQQPLNPCGSKGPRCAVRAVCYCQHGGEGDSGGSGTFGGSDSNCHPPELQ
jgi:hypothetical protein